MGLLYLLHLLLYLEYGMGLVGCVCVGGGGADSVALVP